MGGGGKKDAPDAPDYGAAAEQQAQSSREVTNMQTYANRPNQYTPFGNMTWSPEAYTDPATGQRVTRWNQYTQLDPDMQAALDDQQAITQGRSDLALGMLGRAGEEFGPRMDWSQFQELQSAPDVPDYDTSGLYPMGDPNRTRQRAEDAMYSRMTSRLDPQFQRATADMENKLRNQGLRPGDEAYDRAMDELNMQREDAYQTAMDQSIMGGRQEAESMFGMDLRTREQGLGEMLRTGAQGFQQGMAATGLNNTVRQQQIAEEMQRRGFSLNEINAILTGQQVGMPNMPGFNAASRAEGTQNLAAAQMTGQSNLDQFNAEQMALQGLMSGAGSMGTAFMPISDARLKKNVRLIGRTRLFNLYQWEWNDYAKMLGVSWMPTSGVIAQQVQQICPEAVVVLPTGVLAVNYELINSYELQKEAADGRE